MKVLWLLVFTVVMSAHAEPLWDDPFTPTDDFDLRLIEKDKEVYLRDESLMINTKDRPGLKDPKYYSGSDGFKLGMQLHIPAEIDNIPGNWSAEIHGASRLTFWYHHWWIKYFLSYKKGLFSSVGENASGRTAKPDSLQYEMVGLGLGPHFRFRSPFWEDLLTQEISSFVTYHTVNEKFSQVDPAQFPGQISTGDLQYKGFGLRADYGLLARLSEDSRLGPLLSYQFIFASRPRLNAAERDALRRITFSYLTFAFEYQFIF